MRAREASAHKELRRSPWRAREAEQQKTPKTDSSGAGRPPCVQRQRHATRGMLLDALFVPLKECTSNAISLQQLHALAAARTKRRGTRRASTNDGANRRPHHFLTVRAAADGAVEALMGTSADHARHDVNEHAALKLGPGGGARSRRRTMARRQTTAQFASHLLTLRAPPPDAPETARLSTSA